MKNRPQHCIPVPGTGTCILYKCIGICTCVIFLGELGEAMVLLLVAVPDLAGCGGVATPVSRGVEPHQQVHHTLPEQPLLAEHGDGGAALPHSR